MQQQTLLTKEEDGFDWVNIINPEKEHLQTLADQYGWSPSSIEDLFEADHFPKHEIFDNYTFVILRFYKDDSPEDMDTIKTISTEIAIFITRDYIYSISSEEFPEVLDLPKHIRQKKGKQLKSSGVLTSITRLCLKSYERPSKELSDAIDNFEESIFLHSSRKPMLKSMYYIKRKVDTIRRLLILLYEVVDKVDAKDTSNANTRDLRDYFTKIKNIYDNLSENTAQLLNVSFSAAAHRTNETMRILTIFSVFFMPLTFIVGIYGMNFDIMPELHWKYGYPASLLLMVVITIIVYQWFKRKKWL
ncbi:CorA family divalent cation transporter [Olivibacter sitiensis]|uniref:CorA family divalent cation transporter n=1 Tax=Olivibacter sitiensis TaxID=376470 RepID=UPI000406465B|nr:CorA family divalent cation transporter [Olivibacter sitiensis]